MFELIYVLSYTVPVNGLMLYVKYNTFLGKVQPKYYTAEMLS